MSVPLTVIIPTHGRPVLLERTLKSLKRCCTPDAYEELIVIENGSREGARELVGELPEQLRARYMHVEQGNKSYALNRALKTIDKGLVVFFDDDVRVHPDVLTAYARAGAERGSGFFFGGPVCVDREEEPPDWLTSYLPHSAQGYDLVETRMGDEYLGFNWAAFAQDIKRLGGFDPRFGPGSPTGATGQESDMQKRMLADGMKGIDVPNALVWHYVPERRCNAQWVLERSLRDGAHAGLTEGTWISAVAATKNLLKYAIQWLVYKAAMNEIEVYNTKLAFWGRIGFLKGYLGRNEGRVHYTSGAASRTVENNELARAPMGEGAL